MNNKVTSKEEILRISKKIVLEKGVSSFSMRAVALDCDVAVGSIYNYFPSKTSLLGATIGCIWDEIFTPFNSIDEFDSFIDCVQCMLQTVTIGNEKYNGFFALHAVNFTADNKSEGKLMMEQYYKLLENKLVQSLNSDKGIREHVFDSNLTPEMFANYVFSLILSLFIQGQKEYKALIKFIENCIY